MSAEEDNHCPAEPPSYNASEHIAILNGVSECSMQLCEVVGGGARQWGPVSLRLRIAAIIADQAFHGCRHVRFMSFAVYKNV